jgi:hypothetical protein
MFNLLDSDFPAVKASRIPLDDLGKYHPFQGFVKGVSPSRNAHFDLDFFEVTRSDVTDQHPIKCSKQKQFSPTKIWRTPLKMTGDKEPLQGGIRVLANPQNKAFYQSQDSKKIWV